MLRTRGVIEHLLQPESSEVANLRRVECKKNNTLLEQLYPSKWGDLWGLTRLVCALCHHNFSISARFSFSFPFSEHFQLLFTICTFGWRLPFADCSYYIYCLPSILCLFQHSFLRVVRFGHATTSRVVFVNNESGGGRHGMIYLMIWQKHVGHNYGELLVVRVSLSLNSAAAHHAGGSASCSLMKLHFN